MASILQSDFDQGRRKFKMMENHQQSLEDLLSEEEEKESSKNVSYLFSNPPSTQAASNKKEEFPSEVNSSSLFLLLLELIDRTRGSLAAMKTLAFYSRENFRDADLGDYFYRVVSEDIEKTISLLDCFCDYIHVNTPVKKMGTVRNLIEEVSKEFQNELTHKNIKIIKKKYDPELPETTLTDEQLRFILNSIFQYILFTLSPIGRVGILTRSIEAQKWDGENKAHLQANQIYIEILFILTHLTLKDRSPKTLSPLPKEEDGKNKDLILQMVKGTLEKNRGAMEIKWDPQKKMTLLSLLLPIERRNVFQFRFLQDRLKKTERKD